MTRLFILLLLISLAFVQCDSEDNPVSNNDDTTDLVKDDSISVISVSLVYNAISNHHLYFTIVSSYPGNYSPALDLEIVFSHGEYFDQIKRMMLYSNGGVGWEFDHETLQSLNYQDSTLFIPNVILTNFRNQDLKFELECFDGDGNSLDIYEFIMMNRFPKMVGTDHNWLSAGTIDIKHYLSSNRRDALTDISLAWIDAEKNIISNEEIAISDLSGDNTVRLDNDSDNLYGYYSEISLSAQSVRQEITTSIRNVADDRPPETLLKTDIKVINENDIQYSNWSVFESNVSGDLIYFDTRDELIYEIDGTDGSLKESHELISTANEYDFNRYWDYNDNFNLIAFLGSSQEVSVYDLSAGNTLFSRNINFSSEELYIADSLLFTLRYGSLRAYTYRDSVVSEIVFNLDSSQGNNMLYMPEDSIMYVASNYNLTAYKLDFESSEATLLDRVSNVDGSQKLYNISANRMMNEDGMITQLNKDSNDNYSLSLIKNLDYQVKDVLMVEEQTLLLVIKESQSYNESEIINIYDLNTLEKINEIEPFYESVALGLSGNTIKIYEFYAGQRYNNEDYSLAIESFPISELRTYGKTQNKRLKSSNSLKYFMPFTE